MAVYIGLGANLDHPQHGGPEATLRRAVSHLSDIGVECARLSRWYRSSPVPASNQPWYVNAVAEVRTGLAPDALLAALHRVEDAFGRIRAERDGPRWIDLDLLDYNSIIKFNKNSGLSILPHPRLHERAFVLLPLAELALGFRHPISGELVTALIARLPASQKIVPIGPA